MITIITGFGRCGTSLVLQMLAAGGYPVHGEFPSYEADGYFQLPACDGKAVKILDPYIMELPLSHEYRIVWLDRDPFEQAKSHIKFLAVVAGIPAKGSSIMRFERSFRKDRKKYLSRLLHNSNHRMLFLCFEDVLANPDETARALARFVGEPLDVERMAKQVLPRSPKCTPEMLETDLLQRGTLLSL